MTSRAVEFKPLPKQTEAIESELGPALVLAGPGAGKTFCLIRRVEYLIGSKGFVPERICTVTFTNKAAEEVTARLHKRLGERADRITRGTLHSLCLTILREYPQEIGLRRGFGVADDHYQQLLLRRLGVYPERRRGQLLMLFGRHRLQGYELTEGDDATFDSYISLLREKNLVDFDDIIRLTDKLFRERTQIADEVARRWDYLLVDEFQDLDATQYSILKRLAEGHRNIFGVGDDEQSIFSWRGSDPRILWRFRTDFDVEDPIVLDRNWRCSRQIFDAARRLLTENPVLFEKKIEAERESEFEVEAYAFEDEEAEAAWILEHLVADRGQSKLGWGEYALLYRKHDVGEYLEKRLVAADVPCRLARGRALLDDQVIAYVVASLRVVSAPADSVAVEAFAERMLPENMLAELRALASSRDHDFLAALRAYARQHPRDHPDTKKAWRFVYHVENLRALHESHDSLGGLVEELLSQRVKPYENRLEEHYDELEDPESYPGAADLTERLKSVVASGGTIYVEPGDGSEIAMRGMLLSVGLPAAVEYGDDVTKPGANDLVLAAKGERSQVTTLFKALQLVHSGEFGDVLSDYVAFDLETSDLDIATCEIIELGAAKVKDGEVVDTFHSLVRCSGPISAGATEVHGYSETDLREAPALEDTWPRFLEFAKGMALVAHNGHRFDVPVLRRSVDAFADTADLVFFDTLPLARSLFRESARLTDLAERFGIPSGRAHHALDDAVALAHVFGGLSAQKRVRARKAALVNLLDHVGLGLALEPKKKLSEEEVLLLDLAKPYALGRFSDCLDFYAAERERAGLDAPEVEDVIRRLGGRKVMERIRAERSPAERYPAAVARLQALIDVSQAKTLEESIHKLLERVALSTSEGVEADPHRVNLLTLHSTKGLEFSRVYIVGVEDYQMPGYYAAVDNRKDDIEEARRLLYVGMTRAKDRLMLTRVVRRQGKDSGGSLFLNEIGLVADRR
jgi:superfamily I DNA/RNA helicase/inhibitor of KinA sporulation pathway (predicted exonuclease)